MADALPQFVVFDHDSGQLELLVKEKNCFSPLATTKSGDLKDAEAKDLLLGDLNWKIAFVHINDEPWSDLSRGAPVDQVLLRFSTQGYPPTPPQGAHALCIHCIKKISALEKKDIKLLKAVLASEKGRKCLREKKIPERIAHLISFEEPHRSRALHILLLGVLAVLASSPNRKRSAEAKELLGGIEIPPLPNAEIDKYDKYKTLWRGLGLEATEEGVTPKSAEAFRASIVRELGVNSLSDKPNIDKLVTTICSAKANDCTDKKVVIDGFKELSLFLSKQ
ncbi:MAG: hypothetical protein ABL869_03835 [Candidatus Nitrotoga sp.]